MSLDAAISKNSVNAFRTGWFGYRWEFISTPNVVSGKIKVGFSCKRRNGFDNDLLDCHKLNVPRYCFNVGRDFNSIKKCWD